MGIYEKFIESGMTIEGACGLLGNLQAESNLQPDNVQNSYERKLGLGDKEYTKAVDNGTYKNFVHDSVGYGIAQWTYWTRKQKLLEYAHKTNRSIGNLDMQVEFLISELKTKFTYVWKVLTTSKSVYETTVVVLTKFEAPADQGLAMRNKRVSFANMWYNKYRNHKDLKKIVEEIKSGKWGNGVDRKNRLEAAGYNYSEVQKLVNQSYKKYVLYEVKKGDTLYGIALRYYKNGNKYTEIMEDNNLTSTIIHEGQKLKIQSN